MYRAGEVGREPRRQPAYRAEEGRGPRRRDSKGEPAYRARGRTQRDFESYMRESEDQIRLWTEELKKFKVGYKGAARKEKDLLRNKISALRSRMKRKQE